MAKKKNKNKSKGKTPSTPYSSIAGAKVEACPIAESCLYIVGIDFGTTQTGFSFSRKPFLDSNEKSLRLNTYTSWDSQPPGFLYPKAPTAVAYRKGNLKDKKFGWAALFEADPKEYHVIENVKKCLEDKNIPGEDKPTLPLGMTAVHVITDVLLWMKNTMMQMVTERSTDRDLKVSDFLFCFTVPVGWSQIAHQSIRKAAFKAKLIDDINSRKLVFCFEPEAAALACLHDAKLDGVETPAGTTILVVDAGGGTVDIFLAKVGDDENLEELTMSAGDYLGATLLDKAFFKLVEERMGCEALEEFRTNADHAERFSTVKMDWEFVKRNFDGQSKSRSVRIRVPRPVAARMPPANKKHLNMEGELVLDFAAIKEIFDAIVNKITSMVDDYVDRAQGDVGKQIDYLYLVGGFGSNQYLRKSVSETTAVKQHIKAMVTVTQPGSAVLHGATWCARNTKEIKARRARHTIAIGIACVIPMPGFGFFGFMPPMWTNKYANVFVQRGDVVCSSAKVVKEKFWIEGRDKVWVPLYRSDTVLPSDEENILRSDCELLGSFSIDVSDSKWQEGDGRATIELYYGNVEIGIKVTNEKTKVSAFQFLTYDAYKGYGGKSVDDSESDVEE